MVSRWTLARNLAATLLAGEWTRPQIEERVDIFLGGSRLQAQRELVSGLIEYTEASYAPSPKSLLMHFLASASFRRLHQVLQSSGQFPPIVLTPARFTPLPAFAGLELPRLATPKDLAEWLRLPLDQLDWLADTKRLQGRTSISVLQHYFYSFGSKRNGSYRLIEAPKPELKAIQRQILSEILDHVPAHDSAHGFVKGRSCLSGAQIHAGAFVVMKLDFRDFFASVSAERVHAIFRCLGYPHAVARLLTGICTTQTPQSVFAPVAKSADWQTRKAYWTPHLPQGGPASPALANLSAWHLDQRLAGLARRFGADYTRYADDLVFSGDKTFNSRIGRFLSFVQNIAEDEGFALNPRKTRIMRRDTRQEVTGLVVNDHLNVPRPAYDELKAILHNCIRLGPREQNRMGAIDFRAHLDGRVGWVEAVNPARGKKLRRMFGAIAW